MTNPNDPVSPATEIISWKEEVALDPDTVIRTGQPTTVVEKHSSINHLGLTKLEYFAGLAMQGLISAGTNGGWKGPEKVAELAVEQAKSLIEEINKEEQ